MYRIGPAGYPSGSRNPLDALEIVRGRGLTALEVEFVRQARMSEDRAKELGQRAAELDILLSAHAPYYINFNSRNPETAEKSVEWVMRTAEIAHHMGAKVVVVHAAQYHGDDPGAVTSLVGRGVERCLTLMEERDLDGPLIGLELMGKKAAWGRIEEIGELVRSLRGVVPVVDFAHLHAVEGGGLTSVEGVRDHLDLVADYFRGHLHCHYSSVEFGRRGEIRHLPLEKGEPPFSMIAEALSAWEGGFTIISETPDPLRGATEMMRIMHSQG